MGGNDHWERATLWSSNSILEFLDVVSKMECRPSGVNWVCRDFGESGIYCDFDAVKLAVKDQICNTLTIKTGSETLIQPRGEDNGPNIILQTNLFEYFRVFMPDTEGVRSVANEFAKV